MKLLGVLLPPSHTHILYPSIISPETLIHLAGWIEMMWSNNSCLQKQNNGNCHKNYIFLSGTLILAILQTSFFYIVITFEGPLDSLFRVGFPVPCMQKNLRSFGVRTAVWLPLLLFSGAPPLPWKPLNASP